MSSSHEESDNAAKMQPQSAIRKCIFFMFIIVLILIDDEFHAHPELGGELADRASPEDTLTDAGKQDYTVSQVTFRLQCHGTAIYESVLYHKP